MKRYLSLLFIFILVMSFVPGVRADSCPDGNHDWGEWETVSPATCSDAGMRKQVCKICASENPEPIGIDPNNHSWKEATCISPKTCTRCGATEGAALGHDYSIFLSIAESATYENNAKEYYQCSRCSAQIEKEIPGTKLEPAPANLSPLALGPDNNSFTLTLFADPPTKGTVEGSGTYEYANIAKAIATPNEGYIFIKWTDQIGNTVGNPGDRVLNIEMNSDLTYVAHFSEEKSSPVTPTGVYQVTGSTDPQGLAVLGGIGPHSAGTFVTLTANQSIYPGYIFSHWNLVGAENYNPLSNPCIFVMPENNVAATAVYTPVQSEFKITYAPDEDAKETDSLYQMKYRDVPVTLFMNQFTRDGYVQDGWQTAAGQRYALGAQYIANANLTLYPTWGVPGQHNLTVRFNENGKNKVHTGNEVVTSGRVYPLRDDGSATFWFDTADNIYPYNVKLNGVSKGHLDQIVVYGQAYDQILEIDFESIYMKPKTGDDSTVFLWVMLGISAFGCGVVSFSYARKKRKE